MTTSRVLQITDNYSIDVPSKFICSITTDIMKIPVIASDGMNYEGSSIIQWFAQGNSTSPLNRANINKNCIIFNFGLYNEIREFISDVLVRDHDLLNDGKHNQALKIIQNYKQGLTQGHPLYIQLDSLCQTNKIKIEGLYTIPPAKRKRKRRSKQKQDLPAYTNDHLLVNQPEELNYVPDTVCIWLASPLLIAGFSYMTGFSTVVTVPLVTAALVLVESCSRNRFSFWHNEQPPAPRQEDQRLIPRPQ